MENQEIKSKHKNNSSKFVGAVIILVGIVLFAKQIGIVFISWSMLWPVILIAIGLVNYFKYDFKKPGWLIPVLIGFLFLLEKIDPSLSFSRYTWPTVVIAVGLWVLFGRKNNDGTFGKSEKFKNKYATFNSGYDTESSESFDENASSQTNSDDYISTVAVFGATKNNVFSKSFKGGDITSIFGGTEINFSHADIEGVIIIEATQVFGGTKIIVPPTWDVTSEISAVFGGIDDNRSLTQVLPDRSKVLLIRGTSVFGGIEIRNF